MFKNKSSQGISYEKSRPLKHVASVQSQAARQHSPLRLKGAAAANSPLRGHERVHSSYMPGQMPYHATPSKGTSRVNPEELPVQSNRVRPNETGAL